MGNDNFVMAGCEAAFHCTNRILDNHKAILFVDASNASNNLNQYTTLVNVQSLCPVFAPILTNTYRSPSCLFVNDNKILSQEDTTQGDPLGMGMYAVRVKPLIDRLENHFVPSVVC